MALGRIHSSVLSRQVLILYEILQDEGSYFSTFHSDARGFDYSYGFTGGATNWWNYTEGWIVPVPLNGREVRENGLRILANDTNNCYYPDLVNTKAEQLIRNQDPSKPFYMYFATPVVHAASNGYAEAIMTVPRYQLRPSVFSFTEQFPERKRQLALVQALDDSFMRITDALVNKGIANNTQVIYTGSSTYSTGVRPTSVQSIVSLATGMMCKQSGRG